MAHNATDTTTAATRRGATRRSTRSSPITSHGVDLFANLARSQVRTDRRAGDLAIISAHERGGLADDDERHDGAGIAAGADAARELAHRYPR